MKERPILFKGDMVNAILALLKWQTRRVVNEKFIKEFAGFNDAFFKNHASQYFNECPQGKPGDRLWVRETWRTIKFYDSFPPITLHPADAPIQYKADMSIKDNEKLIDILGKWRPSIFMPRWASRINLELTDVRIERVQDISEEDAYNEGGKPLDGIGLMEPRLCYRRGFISLWDSINKERGYGWDANPLVWVEKFKVVK